MNETLQEFVNSRGVAVRVDRQAGVIRGVKILGLESRNGRSYLPEALREAATLYENAKVNVNHAKGNPSGPRDYQDRMGAIRNVEHRPGEGLFGEFHFNPKHALAEQLMWDAEHAPENVGFSHNVEARTSRRGELTIVEAITRVQSVDLVADPATTRGLFEAAGAASGGQASGEAMTLERLRRQHPALVETLAAEQAAVIQSLREELDGLRANEAARKKEDAARRLLREFALPEPECNPAGAALVTRRFFESLLAAADERAMRELVEERAALVRTLSADSTRRTCDGCRPKARDPHGLVASASDTKSFVEAITRPY